MVYKLNEDLANQKLNDLVHRNIKCLDSYKGSQLKHRFLCLVEECGNTWEAKYNDVVSTKKGCKKCGIRKRRTPISEAQLKLDQLVERDILCLDTYKGCETKHRFKCLAPDCEHVWEASYNNVVNRGSGCKVCARNYLPLDKAQDNLDILYLRNIKCLDEYKGSGNYHNFVCLVSDCGQNWSTTYDNVVNRSTGCPRCAGRVIDPSILNKWSDSLLQRNVICLDEYKGARVKHEYKCLVENCGITWSATHEQVVTRGTGCPHCSGHFLPVHVATKKLDDLVERNIICTSGYKGSQSVHEFRCLLENCNHEWITSYNNVVNKGSGCPKCSGRVLTVEEKTISADRQLIRIRINDALRNIKQSSFSKFHDDNLMAYCQREYLAIPVRPKGLTLDHILPLNFFDPTDDLKMKLCWNRRNLRWVTKSDNSSKNNKIIFDLFDDWHYLVYNLVSSGDYDTELAKSLLD